MSPGPLESELPPSIEVPLLGLLRRLLVRTERPPGRQGVLLPSINVLRSLAPPRLLEHAVADPFALRPNWRQLLHETPHR